jgi:hemolysin activation/secretion protein
MVALAAIPSVVSAQTPPDSGSLQPQPQILPTLPKPGSPDVKLPQFKRPYMGGSIKVKPSGFRFTGNTLISSDELQSVVAALVGKEADFNGLANAADLLKKHYIGKGYLLTDVYFPVQAFTAEGGVVEFAIVEARIGKVTVTVAEGSAVSQSFAQALAENYLGVGEPISEYLLERPVLLLRDMPATDAEATVVPGSASGEADVLITVSRRGSLFEPSVFFDNMGSKSAGEYRVAGNISVNGPLGIGDTLTAGVQTADRSGNNLGRVGYGFAVGRYGTKVTTSYTESNYRLGKQFENLGASGKGQVASLGLVHPLIRGRLTNVFMALSYDDKTLNDDVIQTATHSRKRVKLGRLALLGNHSDLLLDGGTSSFALTLASGKVSMDDASLAFDIGTPAAYGARSVGDFSKYNVELQRVQYLSGASSLLLSLSGQQASKNLTSAEKFNIGGPQGVRAYPVGEGIGDDGVLASVEYRYITGFRLLGEAVSLTCFYDYGRIRRDHVRNATTLNASNTPNSETLDSYGVGALIGREGSYILTVALAARAGGPLPTTGDPDSRVRGWLMFQKRF